MKAIIYLVVTVLLCVSLYAVTIPNKESIVFLDTPLVSVPDKESIIFLDGPIVSVPVDSCTYTSGDWNVDCSDNCVISASVDVGGNNIFISGTGTFESSATISNYNILEIHGTDTSNQCIVSCYNGVCFE